METEAREGWKGYATSGQQTECAAGEDNEIQRHLNGEGCVDGNSSFIGSLKKN